MVHFLKNGDMYGVFRDGQLDIRDELPAQNFSLVAVPFRGLMLKSMDDFVMPPKLYGRTNRHAERILNTYSLRNNSTGVLLSGEKGSGKTLLAKQVSVLARATGAPTIIINTPFPFDEVSDLLQAITQPCVVLFDEFEKTFDASDQEQFLSLFDGVYSTKKLFMVTCNDKHKINDNMKNRPGRLFYALEYKGLEDEFIREFCADKGLTELQTEKVVRLAGLCESFNFDMLQAVAEEMLRYNEEPSALVDIMNVKPDPWAGGYDYYVVKEFVYGGQSIPPEFVCDEGKLEMNLFAEESEIEFFTKAEDYEGYTEYQRVRRTEGGSGVKPLLKMFAAKNQKLETEHTNELTFTPEHLTQLNAKKGTYIFEGTDSEKKNFFLRLEKRRPPTYNVVQYL